MLATFLIERPESRVLLLSTTNAAVDLALIAVDKALEEAGKKVGAAEIIRKSCKRIGSHFYPKNYEGRTHLLPQKDPALVRALMEPLVMAVPFMVMFIAPSAAITSTSWPLRMAWRWEMSFQVRI